MRMKYDGKEFKEEVEDHWDGYLDSSIIKIFTEKEQEFSSPSKSLDH